MTLKGMLAVGAATILVGAASAKVATAQSWGDMSNWANLPGVTVKHYEGDAAREFANELGLGDFINHLDNLEVPIGGFSSARDIFAPGDEWVLPGGLDFNDSSQINFDDQRSVDDILSDVLGDLLPGASAPASHGDGVAETQDTMPDLGSGEFRWNPTNGKWEFESVRINPQEAPAELVATEEPSARKATLADLGIKRKTTGRMRRIVKELQVDEDGKLVLRRSLKKGMSKRDRRSIKLAVRWLRKWRKKNPDYRVEDPGRAQVFQDWMHEDVQAAWDAGYAGQGTSILIIDDFNSGNTYTADYGDGQQTLHHGDWVAKNAGMIATRADIKNNSWGAYTLNLADEGLNVVNASYGIMSYAWSDTNTGITQAAVDAAHAGTAVVTKAAGNSGVAVDGQNAYGQWDSMNLGLIGSQSGLFVGALDKHGSAGDLASMVGYSNFAGDNVEIQDRFLVVGVDDGVTGLAGTSFAAPTVSGYASILGSKFTDASAIEVSNQLLDTARTDTILDYDVSVHGQGEASLSRALAPISIQ